MEITQEERFRLRELAKKQLEIANLPVMEQRKKKWRRLNNGEAAEPLVIIEYGGFSESIYPESKIQSPVFRDIENQMQKNIINYSLLNDDRVILPYIPVSIPNWFTPFGMEAERIGTTYSDGGDSIGYAHIHPITDLERDFHKLGKSWFTIDRHLEKSRAQKALVEDVFGDIIPVKINLPFFFLYNPSYPFCSFMGMQNMMISMYDYPELFHEAVGRLRDEYLDYMQKIEDAGALLATADDGGDYFWGYTDDLPSIGENEGKVSFRDIWGYTSLQEAVGISAEMQDEFFFSYLEPVAEKLGLLAYGCCEPVDTIWDRCLSRLTNLRKLNISPWCNEEDIAEKIRGRKIVYRRKPSANFFADGVFDEESFAEHIEKTVKAAKGCPLEFIPPDIATVRGEPQRLTKAVEIIRQQFVRHWKP